ncbi:MAG: GTP cyclohydrolase I, partial [Bacteroidota bacterium]
MLLDAKDFTQHYKALIDGIGEDSNREGLLKTPERAAKALEFLTHGNTLNADS